MDRNLAPCQPGVQSAVSGASMVSAVSELTEVSESIEVKSLSAAIGVSVDRLCLEYHLNQIAQELPQDIMGTRQQA